MNSTVLTYIASRTVSMLLQIIGEIFSFKRRVALFNTMFGVNPSIQDYKIWLQETIVWCESI